MACWPSNGRKSSTHIAFMLKNRFCILRGSVAGPGAHVFRAKIVLFYRVGGDRELP